MQVTVHLAMIKDILINTAIIRVRIQYEMSERGAASLAAGDQNWGIGHVK